MIRSSSWQYRLGSWEIQAVLLPLQSFNSSYNLRDIEMKSYRELAGSNMLCQIYLQVKRLWHHKSVPGAQSKSYLVKCLPSLTHRMNFLQSSGYGKNPSFSHSKTWGTGGSPDSKPSWLCTGEASVSEPKAMIERIVKRMFLMNFLSVYLRSSSEWNYCLSLRENISRCQCPHMYSVQLSRRGSWI